MSSYLSETVIAGALPGETWQIVLLIALLLLCPAAMYFGMRHIGGMNKDSMKEPQKDSDGVR